MGWWVGTKTTFLRQATSQMPDVLCFDKGGRDKRQALVAQGKAPREFFYGVMELQERGYDIVQMSSAEPYTGLMAPVYRAAELARSHLMRLGLRPHFVKTIESQMRAAKMALSFTDGFSLTLGHYYRDRSIDAPFLVGCFHGLSDIEFRAPRPLRSVASKTIRDAVQRLDHVAFFGPADREFGIARYGLTPEKTSIVLFGVDADFWTPGNKPHEGFIFSMGQDPNRDFDTLVNASVDIPIRLHTPLSVRIPPERKNVSVSSGSYHRSSLSDEELRDLYQRALAVVVPLKDVYQPTGYSVTLQAMACGKAVILSKIRGLWAPDLLVDGVNCLLVKPGDSEDLSRAITKLVEDSQLRERMGKAAREFVKQHFSLSLAAASTERLIQYASVTHKDLNRGSPSIGNADHQV